MYISIDIYTHKYSVHIVHAIQKVYIEHIRIHVICAGYHVYSINCVLFIYIYIYILLTTRAT